MKMSEVVLERLYRYRLDFDADDDKVDAFIQRNTGYAPFGVSSHERKDNWPGVEVEQFRGTAASSPYLVFEGTGKHMVEKAVAKTATYIQRIGRVL